MAEANSSNDQAFEMAADVGPGRSPAVSVRLPALELQAEANDVRLQGQSLTFGIEWNGEPMRWSGTVAGDWLIGEGEFRTVLFPFVLTTRRR